MDYGSPGDVVGPKASFLHDPAQLIGRLQIGSKVAKLGVLTWLAGRHSVPSDWIAMHPNHDKADEDFFWTVFLNPKVRQLVAELRDSGDSDLRALALTVPISAQEEQALIAERRW